MLHFNVPNPLCSLHFDMETNFSGELAQHLGYNSRRSGNVEDVGFWCVVWFFRFGM
jgi:hypothetical protein